MEPDARTAVSVAITVLNEAGDLHRLLDSLAAQTHPPDEVVIVDGGSSDGTWQLLQEEASRGRLPLRLLLHRGANISVGRNVAIANARGPLIACTDAGVRLDPRWLAEITAPVVSGAQFVSGFFESDPVGSFETALGATTLPTADEIDAARFLPSSRSVAFCKSAWVVVGGYPEWLDYCEDLVFDLRMRQLVGSAVFVPTAIARFRPRRRYRDFLRQYYRYARGDGKADLWRLRHAVRYAVYLLLGPALALLALRALPWAWLLLGAGLALMLRRPYARLSRQWAALSPGARLRAIAWVPVVRVGGDLAKMLGYPVGVWWRWRNKPPNWRPGPGLGDG